MLHVNINNGSIKAAEQKALFIVGLASDVCNVKVKTANLSYVYSLAYITQN